MPKVGLVFISCLVFGWVIKRAKWVHNSAIPGYVVLWGAVWLPALSDWPNSTAKTVTQFILLNLTIGFIVGGAATASHRWIVKPLLKKFGVSNGDSDPEAFKKSDFTTSTPPTHDVNKE